MSATDPQTLQEAIVYFDNPDNCIAYIAARRWPNGVECPTCGRKDVAYVAARRVLAVQEPSSSGAV
jgi:hypothetical protein